MLPKQIRSAMQSTRAPLLFDVSCWSHRTTGIFLPRYYPVGSSVGDGPFHATQWTTDVWTFFIFIIQARVLPRILVFSIKDGFAGHRWNTMKKDARPCDRTHARYWLSPCVSFVLESFLIAALMKCQPIGADGKTGAISRCGEQRILLFPWEKLGPIHPLMLGRCNPRNSATSISKKRSLRKQLLYTFCTAENSLRGKSEKLRLLQRRSFEWRVIFETRSSFGR